MGNHFTTATVNNIQPVESYIKALNNVEYVSTMGSMRFMKVAKVKELSTAVQNNALAVIKICVIPDKTLTEEEKTNYKNVMWQFGMRNLRVPESHCLPFCRTIDRNVRGSDVIIYLRRPFIQHNLCDRISTRPFLTTTEKKWIAFQLLHCLKYCHSFSRTVSHGSEVKELGFFCHGDIKSQNILVNSWNWIYLTDFAFTKPTFLPDDNPTNFSFYFDTSSRSSTRRPCSIAPERFLSSNPASNTEVKNDTSRDSDPSNYSSSQVPFTTSHLTPAMDIFSAGCVIGELFTDGLNLFEFSDLLLYRLGRFYPTEILSKIEEKEIRDLVQDMISLKPEQRLTAGEYLERERGRAFPNFFYTNITFYDAERKGYIHKDFSSFLSRFSEYSHLNAAADERLRILYQCLPSIEKMLKGNLMKK